MVSTVTLEAAAGSSSSTNEESTTYAYFPAEDDYRTTRTPTPGSTNVFTPPRPLAEVLQEKQDAGTDFFQFDREDTESSSTNNSTTNIFGPVVDIHIQLDAESLAMLTDHPTYEVYVPFTTLEVSNSDDETQTKLLGTSTAMITTGKIRTKGQSTLFLPACLGLSNTPFQLKFDARTPFLGGMSTVYLRNHLGDQSYLREYGSNVLLHRYGLPYLRVRPVRLYLNDDYYGFYSFMEAPTQPYVMQVRGHTNEECRFTFSLSLSLSLFLFLLSFLLFSSLSRQILYC